MDDPAERSPAPYRPGFGSRPPVLAGRRELLDDVDDAIETLAEDGVPPSAFVVVGPRGVGKSVILDEIADRAQRRYGWVRIHVQKVAGSHFNELVFTASGEALGQLRQIGAGSSQQKMRLSEVAVSGGLPFGSLEGTATFRREDDSTTASLAVELTARLRELANLAVELRTGVVLTIDEVQDVSKDEFGAVGGFAQDVTRLELPFLIAAAGLPTIDNDRLPTYFVRGERHEIGMLTRSEARIALVEPAQQAGRPFVPEAAERMLDHVGGYPFAVQIYGREAWRESSGQDVIDMAAVNRALPGAARRLDRTVHRDHWAKASPTEKRYLAAVAELVDSGRAFTGGDVARVMGQPTSSVAAIRSRLVETGALTFDGSRLDFATPGMARYVTAQVDAGDLPTHTETVTKATPQKRPSARTPRPGDALKSPRPRPAGPGSEDRDIQR